MSLKDPKFEVINSLRKVGGPEVDIIRHLVNQTEALLLEAALIDVLILNKSK